MATRLQQRRARLRAEYGFDFPDDFYQFWELASKLSPLDPLHALAGPLDLALVGPFEVLAGRFDGRVPRHSLLLHWRYHDDPPEFFTVLAGGGDGLHHGYFLDDPDAGPAGCVASYFARDAYELSTDGDTLFEAVRLHLEYLHADFETDLGYELIGADEHREGVEPLARLRQLLTQYETADRPEVGEAYTERYAGLSARNELVVAETHEGMGIVADAKLYRPLSLTGRKLWRAVLRKKADLTPLAEEARRALRDGFPATALELGKDLWATGDPRKAELSYALLDAAYAALGREALRRVLHTHRAARDLPSVDILEGEA
ncbi:MAG: DUF2228 domain-containing protein [Gemmataceae bacterium]